MKASVFLAAAFLALDSVVVSSQAVNGVISAFPTIKPRALADRDGLVERTGHRGMLIPPD